MLLSPAVRLVPHGSTVEPGGCMHGGTVSSRYSGRAVGAEGSVGATGGGVGAGGFVGATGGGVDAEGSVGATGGGVDAEGSVGATGGGVDAEGSVGATGGDVDAEGSVGATGGDVGGSAVALQETRASMNVADRTPISSTERIIILSLPRLALCHPVPGPQSRKIESLIQGLSPVAKGCGAGRKQT